MTELSLKKNLRINEKFFLLLILIFLITTFQRNSLWSDTFVLWSDINQKSPSKWRSYFYLGHHYSSVRNYSKAREYYLTTARKMDDHISRYNIFLNIGTTYLREGEFSKAKDFFRKSIQENPNNAKTRLNLGGANLRLGLVKESLKEYHRALELDPNLFEALYNLGMVYKFEEDLQRALKYLYKARQVDRNNINTYLAIPLIYIETGRYNDAIRDLSYGKELFPNNDDVRLLYQKAFNELNIETINRKNNNNTPKTP